MKESRGGPLSPERPESVYLNKIECCALAHGFAKNPKTVSALMDLMDKKDLKLDADILLRSAKLPVPLDKKNEKLRIAYSQVTEAELKRIAENQDLKFHCKHSATEHEQALRSALEKLSVPEN